MGALTVTRQRRLEGLAGLDELVHEPEVVGPLGVDGVTRQGELHGDVAGEGAGQAEQAARGGHQRALHLGDAEAGVGRGHDQVAGEDDLGATGQGGAVDGGDERLGALAGGDAAEAAPLRLEVGGLAAGDGLEVGAGPVFSAGAGDDADPDVLVLLQPVEPLLHGPGHVAVHGVAGLGAVDGEDGDPSLLAVLDHRGTLSPCLHRDPWW
jgi:hypothetical protein